MRSNSADALPHTSVPVPPRALLATKWKPGRVQVPEAHVNGSAVAWRLVPAKRRAAVSPNPWRMCPSTTSPEAGSPVPLLTLTVAVPSNPPISRVVGLTDARMRCTPLSAQPILLKQQVNPPNPLWLMAVAPNSGWGITSRPIAFTTPCNGFKARSIMRRLPSVNPPPGADQGGHAVISDAGASASCTAGMPGSDL